MKVSLFLTLIGIVFAYCKEGGPKFFRSTLMSTSSFENNKIFEVVMSPGSLIQCAVRCFHVEACSRFVFDGEKCHLVGFFPFLPIYRPNDSVVQVQEFPEWSQVMILGGLDHVSQVIQPEVFDLNTMKRCPNPPTFPHNRLTGTAFVLNNQINYAFGMGGYGVMGFMNDTFQLGAQSTAWQKNMFDAPVYVRYAAAAQIRRSWVLLVSGSVPNTTIIREDGSVLPGPPLPHQVLFHCVLAIDEEHIFVAGGLNEVTGTTKATYVMKWSDQVWVPQASMAIARSSVACETFLDRENQLNVLVGRYSFEIFSWLTRSWRAGPPISVDYVAIKMVRFNNVIYLFGGQFTFNEDLDKEKIFSFHPLTETWSLAPMEQHYPRFNFELVKIPPGIVDC